MTADLDRERYVNLATFRKSGAEVRTPVWVAGEGDRLFVYTNRKTGKVKRIRANGRARLAPCDARGKLRGEWVDATARIVEDPAEQERAIALLLDKYGWQMSALRFFARLSGRWPDRTILELRGRSLP